MMSWVDLILQSLNALTANALFAVGLAFFYYLFALIFQVRSRDQGRFFRLICLGWAFNLAYIWIQSLASSHDLPARGMLTLGLLTCNTTASLFFLVGARVHLRGYLAFLRYSAVVLVPAFLVVSLPFLTYFLGFPAVRFTSFASVLFDSTAIAAVGYSYQSYFQNTHFQFRPLARWLIVLSMYSYAGLQPLYLAPDREILPPRSYPSLAEPGANLTAARPAPPSRPESTFGVSTSTADSPSAREVPSLTLHHLFFLAGAVVKLGHLVGLASFAHTFFIHYRENVRRKRDYQRYLAVFDQLEHEFATPALQLDLAIDDLESSATGGRAITPKDLVRVRERLEEVSTLLQTIRLLNTSAEDATRREEGAQVINVNSACESAAISLKIAMKTRLKMRVSYSRGATVLAKPSELVRAIRNIIKNAIEAMNLSHVQNPELEITTRVIRDHAKRPQRVQVEFSDIGPGVPVKIRERIFEDGFSTKEGRLRGHGLAVAKAIVERHHGSIAVVDPKEGRTGARFVLEFPFVEEKEDAG